ncbi:hypothetical protein JW979_04115 [bacterium]|nr:hypothetical protein [candidate division CSSED10-310 bacterium]
MENTHRGLFSVAGLITTAFMLLLVAQLPGFYSTVAIPDDDSGDGYLNTKSFTYYSDLSNFLKKLLLYPTNQLVSNPVIRMSVTISCFALLLFLIFDILAKDNPYGKHLRKREFLIWLILLLLVIIPALWMSQLRLKYSYEPNSDIVGIRQTESAIEMILKGENPYTETYFLPFLNTSDQNSASPVLVNHNPNLPATFLLPAPFYWISLNQTGYYDQHYFYIIFFLLTFYLLGGMTTGENRLALLSFFGLNPFLAKSLIEGTNVIVIFSLLLITVRLIEMKRPLFTGCVYAFATTYSFFLWLAAPFIYLYMRHHFIERKRAYLFFFMSFIIVFCGIMIPFLTWNLHSFWTDVIAFNTGYSDMSFNIQEIPGLGMSNAVLYWACLYNENAFELFWIPIILTGLPGLLWLYHLQKKNNSRAYVFGSTAFLVLVTSFFSRVMFDSHLLLVMLLASIAVFADTSSKISNNCISKDKMI